MRRVATGDSRGSVQIWDIVHRRGHGMMMMMMILMIMMDNG